MPYADPEKRKQAVKDWEDRNKDKRRAYFKIRNDKNYAENKEEIKAKSREYYGKNQDKARNAKLKKTFGITLDQYKQMLKKQNGVCAICLQPEKRMDSRSGEVSLLAVDHDHVSGKIRGLLCFSCNNGLGKFSDDIVTLNNAIKYLEDHHAVD